MKRWFSLFAIWVFIAPASANEVLFAQTKETLPAEIAVPRRLAAGQIVSLPLGGSTPAAPTPLVWEAVGDYEAVALVDESGQPARWRTRLDAATRAKQFFTQASGNVRLKAVKSGRVVLRAFDKNGKSAAASQEIWVAPVAFLAPLEWPAEIAVGQTLEISAVARDESGQGVALEEVTWKIGDAAVADLRLRAETSSGLLELLSKTDQKIFLTPRAVGTTFISLRGGGREASFPLVVAAPKENSAPSVEAKPIEEKPIATPPPSTPLVPETATPPDGASTLIAGQRIVLPFLGLSRATIKNLSILRLVEIGDDSLTVEGVAPGTAWLEATHGEQLTALKIRVVTALERSSQLSDYQLQTISGGQIAAAAPAGSTPAPPSAPPTGELKSYLDAMLAANRGPKLQISLDPAVGLDSQRLVFPGAPTFTVRRRFQQFPIGIRYRFGKADTVTLDLPFIRREEEILAEGKSLQRTSSQGLGDISIGYERNFPRLGKSAWSADAGFNLRLPTGKSIYEIGENELPLGNGHYEIGGFLGLRRVADPVVFNIGFGVNYSLARDVGSTRVAPGLGFSLQSGIAYALNDRFALSEQLSFSRSNNVLLLNSFETASQKVDQAYLSHGLIFSGKRGGKVLRALLTLGLNDASTDYILSVSLQK